MYKLLLEKLDAKLVTAGGGIILALALSYTLYKVLTNDLTHLNTSINRQAEIQQQTNEILRSLDGSIRVNTEVLREIKWTTTQNFHKMEEY